MDVLIVLILMCNAVLLTLFVCGVLLAKKELDSVLSKATQSHSDAVAVVNTAHESVTSMAEHLISLTKEVDDLKSTVQIQKLQRK